MKQRIAVCLAGVLLAVGTLSQTGCDKQPVRANIYDPQADGATLIADAVTRAQKEHKRVFVELGANWCIWCHRLYELLTTDPEIAPFFKEHFVLVLVDVDKKSGTPRNDETVQRYGDPIKKGIPGVVLLDADGQHLKTQDTSELEAGEQYDHAKVLNFLKQWAIKSESGK